MLHHGARIDHLGYAVGDLATAMREFTGLFGTSWGDPTWAFRREFLQGADHVVDWGVDVVFSTTSDIAMDITIELLSGELGSTWHNGGPAALHHVAFRVDDVAESSAALLTEGWRFELRHADALTREMTFAYLRHPDSGQRVELLSRRPEEPTS